jgi:signal transduction histidine kinase
MSFGLPLRLLRTVSFGLALLYAILLAASAVILGFIVYWTVQASVDREMAARIDAEIEILKGELRSDGSASLAREVENRINYFGALDYFLADADGKRLAGNLPNLPASDGWSDIAIPDPQQGRDPKYFRVKTVHLDNGYRLVVGDDLGSKEDIRGAFLGALGWALIAFLVLTLTAGALLSSAFLSRVDAIDQTAEAIINGDLGSRVPLRGTNDNFDRLSATLNRMLDQIQRLMESLSQVSNDIAHALRTPLGRLRQKLEVARANSGADSRCTETIDAALEETDNILDTFSALVRIAQIESGTRTAGFREIDLSNLFETVSEAFSAVAEDEGKTLTAKIAPSVKFWGDRDLISEMLANLLDNAIRHTPQGAHIEVSLVNHGSQLMASVADDGPGVPPPDRERIFRRFYRVERSIRTAGTGLGLSLVAAVAELHGMRVSATDNKPGLCMTLTFDSGVLNAIGPRPPASRAIDHDFAHGATPNCAPRTGTGKEGSVAKLGSALPYKMQTGGTRGRCVRTSLAFSISLARSRPAGLEAPRRLFVFWGLLRDPFPFRSFLGCFWSRSSANGLPASIENFRFVRPPPHQQPLAHWLHARGLYFCAHNEGIVTRRCGCAIP